MAKTLALVPMRLPSWPRRAMLFGVGAFPLLGGIGWSGNWLLPFNAAILLVVGLAFGGAFLSRHPAWGLSALLATVVTLASLGLLAQQVMLVKTPGGYRMEFRMFADGVRGLDVRNARVQQVDLDLLRRGTLAVSAGSPLLAPEGGYLVPRRIEPYFFESPFRYVASSSPNVGARWRDALAWQTREAALRRDQTPAVWRDSPKIWTLYGGAMLLAALALALLANLAALLGRAVLGAAR